MVTNFKCGLTNDSKMFSKDERVDIGLGTVSNKCFIFRFVDKYHFRQLPGVGNVAFT